MDPECTTEACPEYQTLVNFIAAGGTFDIFMQGGTGDPEFLWEELSFAEVQKELLEFMSETDELDVDPADYPAMLESGASTTDYTTLNFL